MVNNSGNRNKDENEQLNQTKHKQTNKLTCEYVNWSINSFDKCMAFYMDTKVDLRIIPGF